MTAYTPPVSGLLKLGSPSDISSEIDYPALGFGAVQIPELLRLLKDKELAQSDSDTPEVYAHIHAWRALGQLRATEAIEPLLDLLSEQEGDNWSDWVTEEVPITLGQIGPDVIPAAVARLERRGQAQHIPCYYANALVEVAKQFPETRTEVIGQLARVLEAAATNNASMNGFIISDLVDLDAKEAWPAIESAFATGNVDETIAGDAPAIKWDLGLGPEPPPRRYDILNPLQQSQPRSQPTGTGANAKQRFNERMRKKKAEKKQNKKKRKGK